VCTGIPDPVKVTSVSVEVLTACCVCIGIPDPVKVTSVSVEVLTACCVCIGIPDPVKVTSVPAGAFASTYTLEWNVPMTGGAEITQYRVDYSEACFQHFLFIYLVSYFLSDSGELLFSNFNF
jgi:hypothetical protein